MEEACIHFTYKGIVTIFKLRGQTAWEEKNLPVILLTGDQWDPMNVDLGIRTRYQAELRTIKYLTSSMKKREISEMKKGQGRRDEWDKVGNELDTISSLYQLTPFCCHFIVTEYSIVYRTRFLYD